MLIIIGDLWTFMKKMNKQYYPIYKIWGFWSVLIEIQHPDDFEVITKNRYLDYYLYIRYTI